MTNGLIQFSPRSSPDCDSQEQDIIQIMDELNKIAETMKLVVEEAGLLVHKAAAVIIANDAAKSAVNKLLKP